MKRILTILIIFCCFDAISQLLASQSPWPWASPSSMRYPGSSIQLNNGNILFTTPYDDSDLIRNVHAGGGFYSPQTPQLSNRVPVILKHMDDGRYLVVNFYSQNFFNYNHWDTITICRFLPDGTHDSSFNSNGIYPIPIYNNAAAWYPFNPYDLAILKDSSLILTYAEIPDSISGPDVKAIKLTHEGIADSTFGVGGKIILPLQYIDKPRQGITDLIVSNVPILEDNDHHIYFGGQKNYIYKCLIRFSDTGIFDSLYGYKMGGMGDISNLLLDYSGDILAIGTNYDNNITPVSWFVKKYKPDGTLDTGFGVGGESTVPGYYLNNALLQPDGKIILFGQSSYYGNIYAKRLHVNGNVDNSWSVNDPYGQCGNNYQQQFNVLYTSLMRTPGQLIYAIGFNNAWCVVSGLHLNRILFNPCGNGNLVSSLPVLNASNLNLCQGGAGNDTIFITGNLNGASYWEYYTSTDTVPVQVYGNSFLISPTVTTTYYVRGAGYCSGNGPADSITINVNPSTMSYTNSTICINQIPYIWNGLSINSPGIYTDTLINANGCDSIATLNLNISLCGLCQPNFTVNWTPFTDSLVESQTWITTSGTVLIPLGAKVKYDANAGGYVRLNPGFKAEYGAVFIAQAYNGCTPGAPQLPQVGKMANADALASSEIILYPNPTTGMIYIKHDEQLKHIQVFDMVGKLVVNQPSAGETETNIDLSNLPNGVYHVKAAGYNSIKVVKNN